MKNKRDEKGPKLASILYEQKIPRDIAFEEKEETGKEKNGCR